MNRKQRETAKAQDIALKRARKQREAEAIQRAAEKEARIQKALTSRPKEAGSDWYFIGQADADDTERQKLLRSKVAHAVALLRKKAPKLLDWDLRFPMERVLTQPSIRPLETWKPQGKSRHTLFRSLCDHLFAKFPAPAILWSAFFIEGGSEAKKYVEAALHIAAGGSFYAYAKDHFVIPMTRKMCHDFLNLPSDYSFLDGIRYVQVQAAGGDRRFFNVWRDLRYATEFWSKESEEFWYTVVEWFAKQPMLNPAQIGPICDYVHNRRNENPTFSMKGRTGTAILRDLAEWHGTLASEKNVAKTIFVASGFQTATFEDLHRNENGKKINEIWRIQELLSARALHEEGKRMGHCVYSYRDMVDRRAVSIWSVQMEDGCGDTGNWAMVTLEVQNNTRQIVQARGRFNRKMTSKEVHVVRRWAGMNGLTLSSWL